MQILDDETIRFDCSGRTVYAFGPVIGIGVHEGDDVLHYGWDGDINEVQYTDEEVDDAYLNDAEDTRFKLTADEKAEIARHMVMRWQTLYDLYSL